MDYKAVNNNVSPAQMLTEPAEFHHLDLVAQLIGQHRDAVSSISFELHAVADRLFGAEVCHEPSPPMPLPGWSMAVIDANLHSLTGAIDHLRDALRRLKTL